MIREEINRKRELWAHYPTVLAFPNWKTLTDQSLKTIATSHPKLHIPTLIWRHPKNSVPILWGSFWQNEGLGIITHSLIHLMHYIVIY